MKKTVLLMSFLLVMPLSMQSTTDPTITVWNNANWPIAVWPLPSLGPPKLLAVVPPKRQGITTAEARLSSPTKPLFIVYIGEPLFEEFDKMLDEMLEESKGYRDYYTWSYQISRRLRGKPTNQWVIMYSAPMNLDSRTMRVNQMNFNYSDKLDIVVWNDHKQTQYYSGEDSQYGKPQPDRLMSIANVTGTMPTPGPKDYLYNLYPYVGYEGIPSK